MIRFIFRVTSVALILFSGLLVVINTHPYDIKEYRQPFMQDACTGACFVGIQPGVTTVDEALTRLESSGWTSNIDNRTVNNVSGYISWGWSDKKPAWIDGEIEGEIWATQKQVVQIMIYGDMQLGDTRLALGLPNQEVIDTTQDRKQHIYTLYTASYAEEGLMIQSWQPCRVLEPLRRPVILTYTMPSNPKMFPAEDSLADLHHTCALPKP